MSFIQSNVAYVQLRGCLGIKHNQRATEHALNAGQGAQPVFGKGGCACGAGCVGAQEAGAVVQVYEEGKQAGDSCQSQGASAHFPRGEVAQEDVSHLGCIHQGDSSGGEEAGLKAQHRGKSVLGRGEEQTDGTR